MRIFHFQRADNRQSSSLREVMPECPDWRRLSIYQTNPKEELGVKAQGQRTYAYRGHGSRNALDQFGPDKAHRMTPEMAFECVLVCDDPTVLTTIDPILQDFSICTSICPQSRRTGDWLEKRNTDLIVVDLEAANSFDVLKQVQESQIRQKPTVLALSATDRALPGVHIILRKPLTRDSGMRSLKVAYSRMLQDFRKHTRFALMQLVLATDENNQTFSLTVTNIGSGGVGLKANEQIRVGSLLAFRVVLPELESEIS